MLALFALVNLLIIIGITVYLIQGVVSVRLLADQPLEDLEQWPLVSVIVPACNEETGIEEALVSLFSQDYPRLEFILINDRSTDSTGEIIRRVAADRSATVVEISELPDGWLGKNHALHVGADAAKGDYLLFMDADVVMDRSMIRRAVCVAERDSLDHFTCGFEARMPSLLLQSTVTLFTICFAIFFRPWKAKDPKSNAYIGIGGFNLVRAGVYKAIGGHTSIQLRPDDDVKLGKVIKQAGYRQEFFNATEFVFVPWYSTFWQMTVGLEKNSFAVFQYRLTLLLACSLMLLFVPGWPFIAVWLTQGTARWIHLASAITMLLLMLLVSRGLKFSPACVLLFPLVLPLFCWIAWRAAFLCLWRGGIQWRGTLYPLGDLRRNTV